MKNALMIRAISHAAIGFVIMIVFGHGCGELKRAETESSSSGTLGQDVCQIESGGKVDVVNGQGTASLAYGDQVLDNLLACTGVSNPSSLTIETYNQRAASLSEYGYATEVSAPMFMGIAAIAMEVCENLIVQEALLPADQRMVFGAIDFNSDRLSEQDLSDSISLLAQSCWQRNESDEESDDIISTVFDISDNPITGAHTACTAMLASLSSVQM